MTLLWYITNMELKRIGSINRKSCIINGNVGVQKSSIHIMSGGHVEGGSVIVNGDMSREAFMELLKPK